MDIHKKLGTITMVFSIILAFTLIAISEHICTADAPAANAFWTWLSICVRFVLYESFPGSVLDDSIYVSGKYLMLVCVLIFGLGFLWYRGALPIPESAKTFLSPKGSESP